MEPELPDEVVPSGTFPVDGLSRITRVEHEAPEVSPLMRPGSTGLKGSWERKV